MLGVVKSLVLTEIIALLASYCVAVMSGLTGHR